MTEVIGPFGRRRDKPRMVAGGYGVVPASTVDTTAVPPGPAKLTPKEAQAVITAELIQAVRAVHESTTELTARIGRQGSTNGVLDVFVATFPTAGIIARDYPVTVGSVVVVNHSAAGTVTVSAGPEVPDAPTTGRGLQLVAPGGRIVMPVGGRQITMWGTDGDKVSVQVYTGLQPVGGTL